MTKHEKKNWSDFKAKHDDNEMEEVSPMEVDEEAMPGLGHPSYADLEAKLTEAEQTAHDNWEKSVRAMAELDNVRRRSEKAVQDANRYAVSSLISALLPVIDSLDQAIQMASKREDASMQEGLELTMKQFLNVLEKQQVTTIDPQGLPFDPLEHEAMSMQESEGPANIVLAVFQKGYKLHDRVIRPARVIVSKTKK